jgi:hypothetical protein
MNDDRAPILTDRQLPIIDGNGARFFATGSIPMAVVATTASAAEKRATAIRIISLRE